MKSKHVSLSGRRNFLRGACGVTLALPFFDALALGSAKAEPRDSAFALFMVTGNGMAQENSHGYLNSKGSDNAREPERWWLRDLENITPEGMAAEPDRGLSVLAPHASSLNVIRTRMVFHSGGGGQHEMGSVAALSAARQGSTGGNSAHPTSATIDHHMARFLHGEGAEPLTLMAGPEKVRANISFSAAKRLFAPETDPLASFTRLMRLGAPGGETGPNLVLERRNSVNDYVREELASFKAYAGLSLLDRERLDHHLTNVRDFEQKMVASCAMNESFQTAAEAWKDNVTNEDYRVQICKAHADVLAMSVACGINRVGTLQVGNASDGTRHTIAGVKVSAFHKISHRVDSDGGTSAPELKDAHRIHHEIDKIHGGIYMHLLDALASYQGANGNVLEQGMAVWTSQLSTGDHGKDNLPWLMAGNAGGFFKTGQYVDTGRDKHNVILNAMRNALGERKGNGDLVDDFGDADDGVLQAVIA